ncbi:putative G-protein coupled receptor 33 [Discoglossus pictus]
MHENATSHLQNNITDGKFPTTTTTSGVFTSAILFLTFLFGLVGNSLYLWVLWFRIKNSVNTTFFFHVILANLFFVLTIPFCSVYFILKPHWIFGVFLCKVINSMLSLTLYTSVFLLTIISVDRYMLVFHPHWCRRHISPRIATLICLVLWGLAFIFSSPYLVFRQVKQENKTTICYNDYSMFGKWDNKKMLQVKWSLFYFRVLVGFILPLVIITMCYLKITHKIRKEHMTKSSKPYKIIFAAITSFFISYITYHIWYGMAVEEGRYQQSILQTFQVLAIAFICFHCCFTPILYLFIVESFKKMFRKSILSLIESAFNETFISTDRSLEEKTGLST